MDPIDPCAFVLLQQGIGAKRMIGQQHEPQYT